MSILGYRKRMGLYLQQLPILFLSQLGEVLMFGKLFVAWLQLRHQKTRLIVALAGVIFAVVIIFMQFGLREALFDSSVRFHQALQGDVFLISPRSTALMSMESFSKRRLIQALAFKEVDFVSPIYVGFVQWRNPQKRNYWRKIFVIGFDPKHSIIDIPGVLENQDLLKLPEQVLFDQNSRSEFGDIFQEFLRQGFVNTEVSQGGINQKIKVVGLFELGTSFGADGLIITSDLNFLQIFGKRPIGLIDIGLIKLKEGTSVAQFTQELRTYFPKDIKVLSKQEYMNFEKDYWNSSTAIGFIFSLGSVLGLVVGIVVVYQILYSNVSEHLSEYATLKAMGYHHRYLLSMVLQQAILIAVLGYIPGFLISMIIYNFTQQATLLPIAMNFSRAIFVFTLTVMMCFVAGATAVRKLKAADPADIF